MTEDAQAQPIPWWEDDLAPDQPIWLTMLESFSYCPRQFALKFIEGEWEDNVFTLRGAEGHARADEPLSGVTNGVRWERALPVWSRRWGLVGRADLVEFPDGLPYPVEFKHGSPGGMRHYIFQLCAQALCLEEMFNVPVLRGAIYSIKSRRRREVILGDDLRRRTEALIGEVRAALKSGVTHPPPDDRRCRWCSLVDICQPALFADHNRQRLTCEARRAVPPTD